MDADTRTKLTARLRTALNLPDSFSDEEILEKTEGSLLRAQVEFGIAKANLRAEIKRHCHGGKNEGINGL